MNEEELNTLRHSFTSKEDAGKFSKNQFGHTVLGTSRNLDISGIDVKLNEYGEISAEPTHSLLDSPELLDLAGSMLKKEYTHVEASAVEPKKPFSNAFVTINDLISSLDVMDGTNESPNIHPSTFVFTESIKQNTSNRLPDHLKSCLNKDCLYGLPKEAKFCLKCGTAQMPKFCTECGYSFPGMEKFCPDCGNKR